MRERRRLRPGHRRAREHAPQLRRAVWPLDEFRADGRMRRASAVPPSTSTARDSSTPSVAAGLPVSAWSSLADTVTVCFSKGLGCPFGAVLAGSAETIERAWEGKFLFGGALRQSGIAAAAMLYALDDHVERLADDHARAKRLAEGIGLDPGDRRDELRPDPRRAGLQRAARRARRRGRRPAPGWLRAVTHLDIGDDDIDAAIAPCRRCSVSTPERLKARLDQLTRVEQRDEALPEPRGGRSPRRRADLGEGRRRRRRRGEESRRRPTRSIASARSRRRSPPQRSCSSATPASSISRTRSTGTSRAPRTRRRSAGSSRTRRACSARRTTTRG